MNSKNITITTNKVINFYHAVNCIVPMAPVNGTLGSYTNTREGASFTFQCYTGFTPTNVFTAICNSLGRWYPAPEELNCTLSEGRVIAISRSELELIISYF